MVRSAPGQAAKCLRRVRTIAPTDAPGRPRPIRSSERGGCAASTQIADDGLVPTCGSSPAGRVRCREPGKIAQLAEPGDGYRRYPSRGDEVDGRAGPGRARVPCVELVQRNEANN